MMVTGSPCWSHLAGFLRPTGSCGKIQGPLILLSSHPGQSKIEIGLSSVTTRQSDSHTHRNFHRFIHLHSRQKFEATSRHCCSSISRPLSCLCHSCDHSELDNSSKCKTGSFSRAHSGTYSLLQSLADKSQSSIILHRTGARLFSTDARDTNTRLSAPLQGEVDRYKGVWVDLGQLNADVTEQEFDALLRASLVSWRVAGLVTAWLQMSVSQGSYVTTAARCGFKYHHAEGQRATLVLGLDPAQESHVPMFASHQVGVSGVVIKEDTREVLVVQDKNRRYTLWKFPGGLADLGEDIAKTAERETFEETGLKTEFQSILAFRQQHEQPGAFGRSDLYILCRLKPLTFDLNPCTEEISACQWMSVEELKSEVHASSITHRMAQVVDAGLHRGWDAVDICSTQMKSIYKGKTFHLFHRPL